MELHSAFDELCAIEETSKKGRRHNSDDEKDLTSENLEAERRMRLKLSERLLALRALVPIITNMNKATVIGDAIQYIMELQKHVKDLSDQLFELEASSEEEAKPKGDEIDAAIEMKKCGIQADVQVTNFGGEKLWIKVVFEKKRGGFTKLLQTMSFLGLEFTDTSVSTSKGAIHVTSYVEGIFGQTLTAARTRELLLEIIRGI